MSEPYRIGPVKSAPTAMTLRDGDGRLIATVYDVAAAKLLAAGPLMKDLMDAMLLWKSEPNKVDFAALLRLAERAKVEHDMAGRG